jgi:Protein of unknown function (DUF3047)
VSPPLLLLLQTLTNLNTAQPAEGLPRGWTLVPERGASAPRFRVTRTHFLRIEVVDGAGSARLRLRQPLRPPVRGGTLTWGWQTGTPIQTGSLRLPSRDDSPVRVFVLFDDGRTIFYSWGNTEGRGESFQTGGRRAVVVLERAEDADGSWHVERRDPFADYRRVFNRAPKAIVAVGLAANTNLLGGRAVAEVGDLEWEPGAAP